MAHSDRQPPPRPYAKEHKAERKRWYREQRQRLRAAVSHQRYDLAEKDERKTSGWLSH